MDAVRDREIFSNPYIIQMDRFADSLKHLSERFFYTEDYKGAFTAAEVGEMSLRIFDRVCGSCEKKNWCFTENKERVHQMVYDVLGTVEDYGAELNIETKRSLQSQCEKSQEFITETLDVFGAEKQKLLWANRLVQNRESSAAALLIFADAIQSTVRELGAGIYGDERLEKRIRRDLQREGVRLINSAFYLMGNGRHEIHLTLKAKRGYCIATKEIAGIVSRSTGHAMQPENGEQLVVWEECGTVILREEARFYTRQGTAKIGKGCETISGDSFLMTALPGGRVCMALSDGMGSGREAFQESAKVIEMLEELLRAGFPLRKAVQLLNTALVTGREDVCYSTVDLCLFDLYEGTCEFLKAGAAETFVWSGGKIETIASSTLPVGVLQKIELEETSRRLEDGSYVIMVTDGVIDALPFGQQEQLLTSYIKECKSRNPKEMAHQILESVLERTGRDPADDMTVIVIGIWEQ